VSESEYVVNQILYVVIPSEAVELWL